MSQANPDAAATMFAEMRRIVREDGRIGNPLGGGGLFRGIWPNLLKIGPSVSVAYFTYHFAVDKLENLGY